MHLTERSRVQTASIMAGVMLAIFLAALDQTVVSVAMPRIAADLNGFALYSWVFTAYMLTSTTVTPIAGKLSDLYGRKATLVSGAGIFVVASGLCGMAPGMVPLALARGVQGLGAGMLLAGAFTAIGDLFAPAERAKWQGLFAAVFGLAGIAGPVLGGFITDTLTWRWVFYVNVPLGVAVLGALVLLFPGFTRPPERHPIDFLGAGTLTAGLIALLMASVLAGAEHSWLSPEVMALLAAAGVMGLVFALVERRAPEPIIPLGLFTGRIFTVSTAATFLSAMSMFGSFIYLPLFLQAVTGLSGSSTGIALAPMTLAMVLGNVISGQIVARTGRYQRVALGGLALQLLGLFLLTRMGPSTTQAIAIRNTLVTGLGMGLAMPIFTVAVQNAVPHSRLGVSTSVLQLARSLGATLGVAIMGSLVAGVFVQEFAQQLPGAARGLPANMAERLRDPQVLINASDQAALLSALESLGPQAGATPGQVIEALRQALAVAIDNAFLAALAVAVLASACTLFLKEIPLRRTNRAEAAPAPSP